MGRYKNTCTSVSSRQAKLFWEISPDILCLEDFNGRLVDVNPAFEKILKYRREEVLGKYVADFLHPDETGSFMNQVSRVFLGQNISNFENRFRCEDGSYKWLSWYTIPVPEEGLVYGVARDVTERRNTEEALKESEIRLKIALDSGNIGIYEWNVITGEMKWDAKIYEFWGLSPQIPITEEILFKGIHPDDRAELRSGIQRYLQPDKRERYYTEYRVIGIENGLLRWVSTTGQVFFEGDRPVKVIGTITDITRRKMLEDSLIKAKEELEAKVRERTAELQASEEKYRLLVENASEAVVVFQDAKLKFFNPKALEISGYSGEELESRNFIELVHPEDREMVLGRYYKRLKGEAVPPSYEFRIMDKDGKIKWLDIHAVPISWEGRPAVLGLLTDITQRKEMDLELKAYARRITEVQEEEKKRIAYELHDDTAQYLSILKLQIDSLLQSDEIRSPELLEKLRFLEKDASRAVEDVRRFSHELRPSVLEYLGLQAAIEQMAEDVNKLKQIKVAVRIRGEEQKLPEDVKLGFFRIAQEAVNNSRKHSRASKVTVTLVYHENYIRMVVKDDGIGFDVQEARDRTGLRGSLGLISMQERAKLIGASLEIESAPGKGTTVKVEMPRGV